MAKGGTLANIGQALAGYGSALSGNPMYLQNSLLLRQAQQQQAEQEAAKQREQMQGQAVRSMLMNTPLEGTGTPQAKAFQVNGRTVGQNIAAGPQLTGTSARGLMMQQALGPAFDNVFMGQKAKDIISQIFPQGFTGTLGENQVAYQNGKPVAMGMPRSVDPAFKVGQTRDIVRGNALVTEEYQPDGSWKQIGSGPRWEAPQSPQKPFGYDEEQARKAEEAARKNRADEYAFKTTDEGFTDIMRSAAKLGTNPNLKAYTGGFDAMTPNFTAGAKQFASDLDVLKSNLAMNALNAARAGSATGATGFGALSEGELKILQNQIATLDPAVGPENFQRQVVDIIQKTKKMQGALRATRPTAQSSTPSALPGFKIEPLD